MALEPTKTGLVARLGEYEPLRAFSQGGRYWDRAAQQLIREGPLAEFLPAVEVEEDEYGKFGRFHQEAGGREWLGRSQAVGTRGIPREQLERLRSAVEVFRQKANAPEVQPQNRELIERFQLPDLACHPELYRLAGPWWNRRLQILWGCERRRDSSLPARNAVEKLTADTGYRFRRWVPWLLLLLLLLLPAWWLSTHWPPFATRSATQSGPEPAQTPEGRAAERAAPSPAEAARQRHQAAAEEAAKKAQAAAAARFNIVLSEQGQPGVDGTMEVALEVRHAGDSSTEPVPVEQWVCDGQTLGAQNQLRTRLKGGDHQVTAVIHDATGQRRQIAAVVTVVPGQVIATGGKVSVQSPKQ